MENCGVASWSRISPELDDYSATRDSNGNCHCASQLALEMPNPKKSAQVCGQTAKQRVRLAEWRFERYALHTSGWRLTDTTLLPIRGPRQQGMFRPIWQILRHDTQAARAERWSLAFQKECWIHRLWWWILVINVNAFRRRLAKRCRSQRDWHRCRDYWNRIRSQSKIRYETRNSSSRDVERHEERNLGTIACVAWQEIFA